MFFVFDIVSYFCSPACVAHALIQDNLLFPLQFYPFSWKIALAVFMDSPLATLTADPPANKALMDRNHIYHG